MNEHELDREIEAYADAVAERALQDFNFENSLETPAAVKERLKEEVKEALSTKELVKEVEEAVEILNKEAKEQPEREGWEALAKEFKQAVELLSHTDGDPEVTIQQRCQMSNSSLQLIEEIAKSKYNEKDFAACKTLLILLTALNSKQFDYWQWLGISLQELKEFDKATRAYENGWVVRQDVIVNRLLAAECYLELSDKENTLKCCQEAKELIDSQNESENWGEHFDILTEVIASRLGR